MRTFKKIIIRVIVGVLICIIYSYFRGNLITNVSAMEVNAVPNQIIVATPEITTFSPYTHTWNGQTVYSFPPNTPVDWGSGASVYFTYPQNSGATYCSFSRNQSTLSGRIYNASTSNIGGSIIQYEDTTSGGYKRCSSTHTNNYIDFICNNVDSSHGFNIQVGQASGGYWGIVRQLDFTCIQSGEDISNSINANNNENTQRIINNQNSNTTNITNSITNSATSITNEINNMSEEIINNQKELAEKCSEYNINKSSLGYYKKGYYLDQYGAPVSNSASVISKAYYIEKDKTYNLDLGTQGMTAPSYCLYDLDKNKISCTKYNRVRYYTITPQQDGYIMFSLNRNNMDNFSFTGEYCKNRQDDITDTLTDSNISDAESESSSFFGDFSGNNHGLTGVITAPMRLINSLASSSCTPLQFQLPFVHNQVTLPCMSTIYNAYFSDFLDIYQIITTGLIGYWVLVKLFSHVKNIQDPQNDKIEVVDL